MIFYMAVTISQPQPVMNSTMLGVTIVVLSSHKPEMTEENHETPV
jgi:hypothetical protein